MTAPKMSERLRLRMLADYIAGVPPERIEAQYGVARGYVNQLRTRRGYPSQKAMREARGWDRAFEQAGAA